MEKKNIALTTEHLLVTCDGELNLYPSCLSSCLLDAYRLTYTMATTVIRNE